MVQIKTLGGELLEVASSKATGPGTWYTVIGLPQGVIDFLTENRIPQSNVMGTTFISATSLAVLYHK